MKLEKTTAKMIAFFVLIGVFSLSCSGVLGSRGSIAITIPGADEDSARSLVGYADANETYKGTLIYGNAGAGYTSQVFYEGSSLATSGNSFVVNNIPIGTYVFGVLIQDINNFLIGLAIKEISIKAGSNNAAMSVGPGITTAQIGNIVFGEDPIAFMEENKDKYSVSFSEDKIVFIDSSAGSQNHPDNADVSVSFSAIFSNDLSNSITQAEAFLIDSSGVVTSTSALAAGSNGNGFSGADGDIAATVAQGSAGVQFKLTASDNTSYVYNLYLKDVQ